MYNQWDNETRVNAYFDDIEYHIKQQLIKARESIDICVAWITIKNFESTFQKLKNKGVKIRLICNDDNKNSFYTNSVENIYKVKSSTGGLMHNKFCIIDDEILIIGSYNWSVNAHRHFENIFVIENNFTSILRYKNEFEDLIIASYPIYYGNCYLCNSTTINLLVRKDENKNLYRLSIWKLCLANNHCELIYKESKEQYGGHEEEEDLDDKESMLILFEQHRNRINNYMKYNKFMIHAQGYIAVSNEHDNIEYGDTEDYYLNIYWKHIFFRNRIQSEYYEDDIYNIFDWVNDYSGY